MTARPPCRPANRGIGDALNSVAARALRSARTVTAFVSDHQPEAHHAQKGGRPDEKLTRVSSGLEKNTGTDIVNRPTSLPPTGSNNGIRLSKRSRISPMNEPSSNGGVNSIVAAEK